MRRRNGDCNTLNGEGFRVEVFENEEFVDEPFAHERSRERSDAALRRGDGGRGDAKDVEVGDDADDAILRVENRYGADPFVHEQGNRLGEGSIHPEGAGLVEHGVLDPELLPQLA